MNWRVRLSFIVHHRAKNGTTHGNAPGPEEEKFARDQARKVIKAIDWNIMNRTRRTLVSPDARDQVIDLYRDKNSNGKIVDIEKLVTGLDQSARSIYVLDIARGERDAKTIYNKTKRVIDSVSALQR